MGEWNELNMELRSFVISHMLRLEQTSSSLIRTILRMFNENPRTLGNQSSALSFKSKIDLLFDLDEIDKIEYNHLLKLMEIRNQFVHNPDAVTFESLDSINPDINRYIEKQTFDDIKQEGSREEYLRKIFSRLFTLTAGKLLVTEIEYLKGMEIEIRKHINDRLVENMDSIWESALKETREKRKDMPDLIYTIANGNDIEDYYLNLRLAMSKFAIDEMNKLEGEAMKKVFKQKTKLEVPNKKK